MRGKRRKCTRKRVIKAIQGSGGIISTIAGRCEVEWHTIQRYIDTDEIIRQAYENECDKILDMAESVVLGAIKEKDVRTTMWYLENKGRNRGYGMPLPAGNTDNSVTLNFYDSEGEYEESNQSES